MARRRRSSDGGPFDGVGGRTWGRGAIGRRHEEKGTETLGSGMGYGDPRCVRSVGSYSVDARSGVPYSIVEHGKHFSRR